MSLIGIDVGTSATKVGVFTEDGRALALASVAVPSAPNRTGELEVDPARVWAAVREALGRVAADTAVRHDPPRALAISASGDEVFPVDAAAQPLGPCLMSSDTRGAGAEAAMQARDSASAWYRRCGHVPERMDPVNRLLWWRTVEPRTAARAAHFLGWHEFLTLQLCGRAVTDPSLASKWLAFDRAKRHWCPARLQTLGLDEGLLPEILPWGEAAGTLRPALASALGLSPNLTVGVGGFDSICTAIGLGISAPGSAGLACGTWEVLVAPTRATDPGMAVIEARLPIVAFPGDVAEALLWQSPNGASVANWAARLTGRTVAEAEAALRGHPPPAGNLLAVPHLAGAVGLWRHGRRAHGAIIGLTASTTPNEVYAAWLESVALELALAVQVVEGTGSSIGQLRAGGGGTRSDWWMQRKADLTGKPVEVCARPEPGTFGAALLAGAAVGLYPSVGSAARGFSDVVRRFEPASGRAAQVTERLAAYRALVTELGRETPARPAPRRRPPEFVTPALVVDLDALEANVAVAEPLLHHAGKTLRPHFKTHGVPDLALRQRSPAVGGFTCATVGEAAALVAAGVRDVLLANEIVGAEKIRTMAALAETARVIVAVDAPEPLALYAAEAERRGVTIEVLVDVDTGLDRCGVRGATAARDLALAVADTPGLKFSGLMGYEGRLRAALPDRRERLSRAFAALAEAKFAIEAAGLDVAVVSACGTSTFFEALSDPTVTEIQAGTYALMEPDLEPLGLPFCSAVRILGSVISRRPNQVVLDVGRRAVGCDGGLPLVLDPRGRTLRVNDEHAVLAWDGEPPRLGETVALRPTQNRTTFNLHAHIWLARSGRLVETVPSCTAGALFASGGRSPVRTEASPAENPFVHATKG